MARNVRTNMVASYRGRRSFQAMRQDSLMTSRSLAMLGSASINAARSFNDSVDRMSRRLLRFGQITSFIFAGVLIRDFFRTGTGFEKAMSGVRAVSQGTAQDFELLSQRAQDLGKTTVFTATESAEALEVLARAGFRVEESYTIIADVLNLAAAGTLGMAEAATIASGTMRGMNIEAERFSKVADSLVFTANNSAQQVSDLGRAFSFASPGASAIGATINDVNAALKILADRNIRGTRAGTALRRFFTVLLKELSGAETDLTKFNLTLQDSEGNFVGIASVLQQLNRAGATYSDIVEAFTLRQAGAIEILRTSVSALARFRSELDRATEAGGVAAQTSEERLNNLAGDFVKFQSAVRNLFLEIFERFSLGLRGLVQSLTSFFRALDDEAVSRIVSALSALGRILSRVILILLGVRLVSAVRGAIAALRQMNIIVSTTRTGLDRFGFVVTRMTRKLGVLGVVGVAAFGDMVFQITKAILEITGLDRKIEGLIATVLGLEELDAIASRFADRLRTIALLADRFELGIDVSEVDIGRIEKLLEQFQIAPTRALQRGVVEELLKFDDSLSNLVKRLIIFKNQAGEIEGKYPEIFAKAKEEASSLQEFIEILNQRLGEHAEAEERATQQALGLAEAIAKIKKEAKELLDETLGGEGFFNAEQLKEEGAIFGEISTALSGDFERVKAFARGAEDRVDRFANALNNAGSQASLVPEPVRRFVQMLQQFNRESEDAEERAELLKDSWLALSRAAFDAGFATQETVDVFSRDFSRMVEAAEKNGESVGLVMKAMAEDIVAVIDAGRRAGQEIPENLLAVEGAARSLLAMRELRDNFVTVMEELDERHKSFHEGWRRAWIGFRDSAISSVSDTFARFILEGGRGVDIFLALGNQLLKQGLSLLIQWGIQSLLFRKKNIAAISAEHAAQLSGSLASVYAQSFASAAAIPVIGWAIAPGIAAANLAQAAAASQAALATGAALGAATAAAGFTPFQEGGIVTSPVRGLVGEAGPEAIIPLRGPRARQAARELFVGEMRSVINVTQIFQGDNWREDGVHPALLRQVTEATSDAIRLGRALRFPVGTF